MALPLLEARLLLSLEPLLRPPDDLLLVRRFDENVGEEELPFLDPVLFDRERWDFVPLVAIRLTLHPCRTPFVCHSYPTLRPENAVACTTGASSSFKDGRRAADGRSVG